jgi:hypothetical protein
MVEAVGSYRTHLTSPGIHRMRNIICVLFFLIIVHRIMSYMNQYQYSGIDSIPTESCQVVRSPLNSMTQCIQRCLYHNLSTHVISRHRITKECVCCHFQVSGSVSGQYWMSFGKCKYGVHFTTKLYIKLGLYNHVLWMSNFSL